MLYIQRIHAAATVAGQSDYSILYTSSVTSHHNYVCVLYFHEEKVVPAAKTAAKEIGYSLKEKQLGVVENLVSTVTMFSQNYLKVTHPP